MLSVCPYLTFEPADQISQNMAWNLAAENIQMSYLFISTKKDGRCRNT
jgi:hypothetical protein